MRLICRYLAEFRDDSLQLFNNPIRSMQFVHLQEFSEIGDLGFPATLESVPNPWSDLPVVFEDCSCVVKLVGSRDEPDIPRFFAKLLDIVLFALRPGLLVVGVRSEAVGQAPNHTGHVRAEIMLDVLKPQLSPVILSSVVKKCGDHHVFRNGETGMASLAHDQRGNSQKVRHVRNISTLAPLNVEDTCVLDRARKPAGQVELAGRILVLTLASCFHSASMWMK